MKVAFIGLGNMGTPMARRLVKAGHEVTVWNRTRAKAEPLRSEGAKVADSYAEAVSQAEVVVTMLADDAAVQATVQAAGGVIDKLPKGAIHISTSTISVDLSGKLHEEHRRRGHHYIAAPVFGRPEAADAGKLFVAVAGDQAAVERARPILEALGQRVFVVGEKPEMANVVKLSGNFLIASVIESLAEAIALTRKYGIDPHEYIEVLTNTLFAAPVYKTYGGLIAEAKHEQAGFTVRLGLKDIRLALSAAEEVDAPMPVASLVRDRLLAGVGRGFAKHDWSVLGRLAAEDAGVK